MTLIMDEVGKNYRRHSTLSRADQAHLVGFHTLSLDALILKGFCQISRTLLVKSTTNDFVC